MPYGVRVGRAAAIEALNHRTTFKVMTDEADSIDCMPRTCIEISPSEFQVSGRVPDIAVAGRPARFTLVLSSDPKIPSFIVINTYEEIDWD